MLENEPYPSENKKRISPRVIIIALVFLLFLGAFGYIYYFNPTLFSGKGNLSSGNPAKNSSAQNGNQADSLVGGVLIRLTITKA